MPKSGQTCVVSCFPKPSTFLLQCIDHIGELYLRGIVHKTNVSWAAKSDKKRPNFRVFSEGKLQGFLGQGKPLLSFLILIHRK